LSSGFAFRREAVGSLTTQIGIYALCDLDNTPVYVGQSSDGIRQRVQRHLTSARSDVIANRQIDVWEVAFVWEFPVDDKAEMTSLEGVIFHHFDRQSRLMNGTIPPIPPPRTPVPKPFRVIQVMTDEEISDRKNVELRLPRQASHYAQILSHYLSVKDSKEIRRAMDAHFERLSKYHVLMLEK
jgi:hypothetical protein